MTLLSKVLVERIAEYIPGLDKEQLRLDVLNGRCQIENADCASGPVLSCFDLPLRLASGHIGNLELNVPWNCLSSSPSQLRASDLSFRFEEIPFPSHLGDVRKAFEAARERQKMRNIPGKSRESFALRWVHKLLPFFVDKVEMDYSDISFDFTLADGYQMSVRFQLDLSDISVGFTFADGYHVALSVENISTLDSPSSSRAISKKLAITDISVKVFRRHKGADSSDCDSGNFTTFDFCSGLWITEDVVHIHKLYANLKTEDDSVSLIVDVPGTINVKLDNVLTNILFCVRRNRLRWNLLAGRKRLLRRPNDSPSKDARSWFRYAAQQALLLRRRQATLPSSRSDEDLIVDDVPLFKKALFSVKKLYASLRTENDSVSRILDVPRAVNVKLDGFSLDVLLFDVDAGDKQVLVRPSNLSMKRANGLLGNEKHGGESSIRFGPDGLGEDGNAMPIARADPEIVFDVRSLAFEVTSEESRALLRAERGQYRFVGEVHSGFLRTLELLDLSGRSADYCRAIQCFVPEENTGTFPNCVSFRFSPDELQVDLHGLQVTVLRSFVEELVQIVQGVSSVFNRFIDGLGRDEVFEIASFGSESRVSNAGDSEECKICVTGRQLQATVPIHRSSSGAIKANIPIAEYNLTEERQVLSLRNSSLLTRPSRTRRPVPDAGLIMDWTLVLRKLDLDLVFEHDASFQASSSSPESSGLPPNRFKTQWTIHLLNQVYILLVPSQISLIHSAIAQLVLAPGPISSAGSKTESHVRHHLDGASSIASRVTYDVVPDDDTPVPMHFCERMNIVAMTDLVSIELMSEDEFGNVADGVANITCGPSNYSFESVHDCNTDSDTKVIHQSLRVSSVSLEDRREAIPVDKELVLVIPKEHIIQTDGDRGRDAIVFECLTRLERGVEKTSAKLAINDPLFCHAPDLFAAVASFVASTRSADQFDGSTASSGTISDSECNATAYSGDKSVNGAIRTVSTATIEPEVTVRYSISVVNPTVFVPYKSKESEDYGLKLESPGVKIILLSNKNGLLNRNSVIKSKRLAVSMQPQGDVPFSGSSSRFCNVDEWQLFLAQRGEQSEARKSLLSANNFEASSESKGRSSTPVLLTWFGHSEPPAFVASISNLNVAIPVGSSDCWDVKVGALSADKTGIVDLLHFASLFEFLDIVPVPEDVGEGEDADLQPFVPLNISLGNICVHAMAPFVDGVMGEGVDSFLLRIRGGLELRLGRDLEYVTGNARLSADVVSMGGSSTIRDQIFAPCDVMVKVDARSLRVSVTLPRSIHLTVSPLTVKTVARIALLVGDHFSHLELLRRTSQFERALHLAQGGQNSRPEFLVNVRGIVMSLCAEEPRAHLMRLVFRNIKCYLKLPVEGLSWGCLDFDIGDVILEDVISQRVYGNDGDDNVEWRTLFASANDLVTSSRRQRFLEIMPTGLPASERTNVSARAFVQRFRQLNFDERQRALQPCSAADLSQEEMPSLDDDSFLSMRAKWQHPIENLTLHLVLKPLDLHVNSSVLPSLLNWIMTVSEELDSVIKRREISTVSARSYFADGQYPAVRPIILNRLVIEPITIRLATKAPPPPLESSALRRLLDWLVGAECMSGLTLESARVSFGGTFDDVASLFRKLRLEYRNALMSRAVLRQLLSQISTVSALTRVGAAMYLRGNRTRLVQAPSSPTSSRSTSSREITEEVSTGLAAILDKLDEQPDRKLLGTVSHSVMAGGIFTRLQPPAGPVNTDNSDEIEVINLVEVKTKAASLADGIIL